MPKRSIVIERPDGEAPGMLAVNTALADIFGVAVAAVIDTDDKEKFKWVGTQLREARIDGEDIVLGGIILDASANGVHANDELMERILMRVEGAK